MSSGLSVSQKQIVSDLVSERLVSSGWRDQVKERCMLLLEKETLTVDELVAKVSGFARESVPLSVKSEVLEKVRHMLGGEHM